jgi:hypothetical protein
MKIVTKQEFYHLPNGILFSFYTPCLIQGLMVKKDTIFDGEVPIDFCYQDLIGNVKSGSSNDLIDILTNAEKNKSEFELDFDCVERDGLFECDSLYVVYSSMELHEFSKTIDNCNSYD